MADTAVSASTLSNTFKIKYSKKSFQAFNTSTPLWTRIKKAHGEFNGKQLNIEAVLGFTGSVGASVLPQTNIYNDQNAVLTRKKLYARILLDREAMIASKGADGAFEQVTKRQVKKGVESFMRNMERMLFAYENGKIFEGDNSTVLSVGMLGTTAAPYVVVGLSTSWVDGFVEVGDSVQVAGESTILNITAVTRSTRSVSLVGSSVILAAAAAGGTATSAKIYMQGSNGSATNEIQSLLAACKATTSTLYGVTVGERWQSAQINAASAGVTTDLINQLVTTVEAQSGESPDLIVTSYKQYRKIQDILGDRVRYTDVANRVAAFNKAQFNFKGLEWMTQSGVIPVVVSKMCPDDHLFALNTDGICFYSAEAPKWIDDDGTVLLRASTDAFEARYACYCELFVHPYMQGVLYGLA
jgi:hypothetical protein